MFVQVLEAAPIHDAVAAGDLQKVTKLIAEDPACVNLVNEEGAVPLHLAAGRNYGTIVKLLIEKGASVKASTKQGWTALHWAAYMNASDAAAILMAGGIDVQAKAADGKTALQLAIAENSQAVASVLVKQTTAAYTDSALGTSYEQAEKLRQSGDLKQAYDLFSKLVDDDPANEKYNFALGMTCFSMKEFSRAQFAFERVLQKNPTNGRARVELARCLMMLGQDAAAKNEFNQVLATNPPDEVKRNIEAHLDEMQRRIKRWQLMARVDVMGFSDDNVNVGPDSERISISPIVFGSMSIDELTVQKENQPTDSTGFSWSLFGGAVYDFGEPSQWGWGSTAAYFQNSLSDMPDYESMFYQLDSGPRYFGERFYIETPLRFAQISIGGEPLVCMYGVHPSCMFVYGPSGEWRLATLTSFERRDYDTLNDRDGMFASAGEQIRYYFGEQRHSILMGITISRDLTEAKPYEYTGKEWMFGTEYKLPWEIAVYGRIRYIMNDYADKEILAPEDRKDTQRQFTIGVNKAITPSWGVDANYQVTDNSSTFTLYKYDRNVATVSMYYSF